MIPEYFPRPLPLILAFETAINGDAPLAQTLPSTSTSSTRGARAAVEDLEELVLLNCVVEHPQAGPDRPEPIRLNLRRPGGGE